MERTDPEQERIRLAGVYAGQTDEQLEDVASQGSELTEVAREALRAELSKRGLYVGQLDDIPAADEDSAEFRNLVTVRTFGSLAEAELAKGLMDSEGIDSFLFDENMGRLYWINVTGGIKLRVDAENAEAANRILGENVSEFTAREDAGPDDPDPST